MRSETAIGWNFGQPRVRARDKIFQRAEAESPLAFDLNLKRGGHRCRILRRIIGISKLFSRFFFQPGREATRARPFGRPVISSRRAAEDRLYSLYCFSCPKPFVTRRRNAAIFAITQHHHGTPILRLFCQFIVRVLYTIAFAFSILSFLTPPRRTVKTKIFPYYFRPFRDQRSPNCIRGQRSISPYKLSKIKYKHARFSQFSIFSGH